MLSEVAWKQRVADAFDKAAGTYDDHADVQCEVAAALASWIETRFAEPLPVRALEIGCGTGFLTTRVVPAFPRAQWSITDVSPAMLMRCQMLFDDPSRLEFSVADGEQLDALEDGEGFGLICSNLAFQWFVEPVSAVQRLMERLRPGGWLVFSTLAHDNFSELYRRFPFLVNGGTPGLSEETWRQSFAGAEIEVKCNRYERQFPSLGDWLRSLKRIGAATPRRGSGVGGRELRKALSESPQSLLADYRVLFVAARKQPDARQPGQGSP